MTETKGTPGWRVEYGNSDSNAGGQWYDVLAEDGSSVAQVWFPYRAGEEAEREAKVRAYLIAAAPEMLAALKDRFGWCDCGTTRAGQAVCDDCQRDSKLIAKAEGRAA